MSSEELDLGDGIGTLRIDHDRARPKPIHGPAQALTAHLQTLQWLSTPYAIDHFRFLYRDDVYETSAPKGSDVYEKMLGNQAFGIAGTTYSMFNSNSTTFVSREIGDLVLEAADLLLEEGHTQLHFSDVPDEAGVILFERPFRERIMADDDDPIAPHLLIHGYGYRLVSPSEVGRITSRFTTPGGRDIDIEYNLKGPGEGNEHVWATQLRTYGGIMVTPCYSAGDYMVGSGIWETSGKPAVLPMRLTAVPFGPFDAADYNTAENMAPMWTRLVLTSLFRFMWQKLLTPDLWKPGTRAEQRQFQRLDKRKLLTQGDYKVVHLRRYQARLRNPEHVGQGGWTLDHTVVVRGHWRDQWFPSLGPARNADGSYNHDSHRKVWIDPHFRGDGPLVHKHNTTAVIR